MGIIYLYLRIGHLVTACTCKLAEQTVAKGDYHRHRTPARLSPFIADRDQNRPRTKPGRCGKAGTPLMFCIFPGLSRFHAWPFSCVLVGLILRASEEPDSDLLICGILMWNQVRRFDLTGDRVDEAQIGARIGELGRVEMLQQVSDCAVGPRV